VHTEAFTQRKFLYTKDYKSLYTHRSFRTVTFAQETSTQKLQLQNWISTPKQKQRLVLKHFSKDSKFKSNFNRKIISAKIEKIKVPNIVRENIGFRAIPNVQTSR